MRVFGFVRVFVLAAVAGLAVFGLRFADAVLGVRAADAPKPQAGTEVAIFAGGCFWCVEADFDKVPGVLSTTSGYIGGAKANPSYEDGSSGGTGHAEAVKIVYDPTMVDLRQAALRVLAQHRSAHAARGSSAISGRSIGRASST